MRFVVPLLLAVIASPASAADLYPYREQTLSNGLKVLTLEDFSAPVVAVHLWYHVGSKDEMPGRQGFAHMFEHMMFRGTDRLGPEDHFKYIRRVGGSCNAYTAFDQTVYVQELPANQLEMVLWLEAERMGFLKVDQTGYDTERKVVEEERRLGLNRPYGSIPEKALAELFPGRAYAWSPIGNIAHLRAAPVSDLRSFWQRYYVPNNATLVIVGAVKNDDAQKLAQKYFGWMPKDADPPRVSKSSWEPFTARTITLKDDSAPAPAVALAWRGVPAGHSDAIPLELLTTILGGGESSRAYRDIVADRQLAVVAIATSLSLELDGLVAAGAVLMPFSNNGPKVFDALTRHVEALRNEPVTEKELLKAKNQMLMQIASEMRTAASRARALGQAAVLEGDAARVNSKLDRVRAVTAADLQRVAKKYMAPENAVRGTIEQNLLGSVLGKKPSAEETAPITAKPETQAPAKVKAGLNRPSEFPASPPAASVLELVTPVFEKFELPNGLRVIVVPRKGVPSVTSELSLLAGAWSEPKPGTASLTMSMLTKGTAKHGEKELADELETYAIRLGGSADSDFCQVTANCLTEHWPRTMELLAEAVRTPTFPDGEFAKLKKQTLTSLAISLNDPASKAERELLKQLYGTHPYGRTVTGLPEDVKAVTVDDMKGWWKSAARPEQAVLLLAGDVDVARAKDMAQKVFGDWKGEGAAPVAKLPEPPAATATHIVLVDQPGAIQSQIRIAQRGPKRNHPDYAVYRVISDYFGGSFSSRLNEVIRVQKGLTYGARGGFAPDRFDGKFTVSTFSKTESTAAAVAAAVHEIERVRTEGPNERELADTKANFTGKVNLARETPQQVAEELWRAALYGLPDDHVVRTLARVSKVGPEECASMAREVVDPTKLIIVVVGNAEKIKADLEKIAPVTVAK